MVATRGIVRHRHNKWVATLTRNQQANLEKMQRKEDFRHKDLNNRLTSLARSKEIPLAARALVPILIVSNIGLFLSGHLSLCGTMAIGGLFAGQGE